MPVIDFLHNDGYLSENIEFILFVMTQMRIEPTIYNSKYGF